MSGSLFFLFFLFHSVSSVLVNVGILCREHPERLAQLRANISSTGNTLFAITLIWERRISTLTIRYILTEKETLIIRALMN